MQRVILAFILISSFTFFAQAQNWKRAGTTRYWDCSKPHCAWKNLPPNNHGQELPFRHEYAFKRCNNCPMGAKYFGTAAAATGIMGGDQNSVACGKCFALRAVGSSEVKLILQVNNLCPGNSNPSCQRDHFDIAVPGFDWNDASVSNTCRQNDPQVNYRGNEQVCMRSGVKSCNCDAVSSDPALVEGCKLFVELGWDNQEVDYTEVACPGSGDLGGSGGSPSNPTPPTPPAGGPCSGVKAVGDQGNEWWVEFEGPDGTASIECTGNQYAIHGCTRQWGKWTCSPQGKPCLVDHVAARFAIVNGKKCKLRDWDNAVADVDEFFGENVEVDAAMTDDAAMGDDTIMTESSEESFTDAAMTDDAAMGDETVMTESAEESFVDAAVGEVSIDTALVNDVDVATAVEETMTEDVDASAAMGDETVMTESAEESFVDAAVDQSSEEVFTEQFDAAVNPTDVNANTNTNTVTPQETQQQVVVVSGIPAWGVGIIALSSSVLVVLLVLIVMLLRMSSR